MEDQPIQENPLKVQLAVATNNTDDDDDDDYLDSFPSGFRFMPYDGELIVYYLMRKIKKEILPPNRIHDVNLYKFNPESLAERYKSYGEKEWYFFTPRDRKYRNGQRPNRAAGDGYWKATGTDKLIKFKKVDVGSRTALVFYKGRPPKGQKTNWIMHEFRIINSPPLDRSAGNAMRLDDCILCKIYQNVDRSRCKRNRHCDDDDEDNGELPLPAQQYYNEQVVPIENFAMTVASEESFMPNKAMEMESDGYNRNANPNSFSRTCDFLPPYPNGFLQVPSQLPFNHRGQVMTNPYLHYPNDNDMKPALPLNQYPIHAMERNMRPFNQIDYPLPYFEPRGLDEEPNDWSLMLQSDNGHMEEMFAKLPHPGDNQ